MRALFVEKDHMSFMKRNVEHIHDICHNSSRKIKLYLSCVKHFNIVSVMNRECVACGLYHLRKQWTYC